MRVEAEADLLRDWYARLGRPFLEEFSPERVGTLDPVFERLRTSEERELPICFLGNAGVGKSTLINALVAGAHSLVPAGGVGPLTAQATLLRHARGPAERRFRVEYHPSARLNNVLFAIERWYERTLGRSAPPPPPEPGPDVLDESEVADAVSTPEGSSAGSPGDKVEGLLRQACQLIYGKQFEERPDVPYLLDGLRECRSSPTRWGTERSPADAARVAAVRQALALGERTYSAHADQSLEPFLRDLQDHASGFLAPIIKTLEVWWDADVLRPGLVFVDLPGVGVANDEYRLVTAEWIRKARAVVLVVNSRGISEDAAELLRSTGFLTSLLHESPDSESGAPLLLVAAVQLDIVAEGNWRDERERVGREKARSWAEHFADQCAGTRATIRGQARTELEKQFEGGSEATRQARAEVLNHVLSTLQIHTVSAWEYRKLLVDDEEDRPRIKTAAESHLPALAASLSILGAQRQTRLRTSTIARATDARERARAAIEIVLTQWREGARAEEEAARLRSELDALAKPLRAELATRQGEFREFLRSTMLQLIRSETHAAAKEAQDDIARYLRKLESYHWNTLRAAVRRGGTFVGSRHVDIPNELTLRFEEPIAVVWSRKLLVELRRRTRGLADDHVRLVGEILTWARGQGARVRPELVEAIHNELKAQSNDVADVGREAIDDLRARVKQELFTTLEDEVRKRCRAFVTAKHDQGGGVKSRIHKFLQRELLDSVMSAAEPAAIAVLEANYKRVDVEIKRAFERVANPVETAIDAIASAHEATVRRSDAQKRRRTLELGEGALDALPTALSVLPVTGGVQ